VRVAFEAVAAPPRTTNGYERRLRVFVLSDVRLYSDGLAALLVDEPFIEIVGASAWNGGNAQLIVDSLPDVLLVDAIALRRGDLARRLAADLPAMIVVACGVTEEIDEVIACAQCGASGYVARDASAEDLVNTVRSIARGELPCSPRVSSLLFRQMALVGTSPSLAASLTAREHEVMGLIDKGKSNKEIAGALCIEVATVKNHVHHILEKLDVRRRAAATALLRRTPVEERVSER
jgi:two-component system nitrate/nitrite response regulator NarL